MWILSLDYLGSKVVLDNKGSFICPSGMILLKRRLLFPRCSMTNAWSVKTIQDDLHIDTINFNLWQLKKK